MIYFFFGDVEIKVFPDYFPALIELAFAKGFAIAEKLQDVEAEIPNDVYVDINGEEMLELAELLVAVVK